MTTPHPAFAVLEGSLCRVGPFGGRAVSHRPLASAVVEFRRGPFRTFVREHPFGLLPGFANLYCLDGAHRLQWIAEWPFADDACARIVDETAGELVAESVAGVIVRLDAATGQLRGVETPVAAAV
ncbi:MAG: hypothetical protein RLZZ15_4641 [Verrucomicrobiota bacterium]|jgi:hypothetical protein